MSIFASPRFLRLVMWADAASCAATGTLQLALQRPLADLTGLPPFLLAATGLFLLAYASAAAWMARRQPLPRTLIGLVALGNLGWALAPLFMAGITTATGSWRLACLGGALCAAVVLAIMVFNRDALDDRAESAGAGAKPATDAPRGLDTLQ